MYGARGHPAQGLVMEVHRSEGASALETQLALERILIRLLATMKNARYVRENSASINPFSLSSVIKYGYFLSSLLSSHLEFLERVVRLYHLVWRGEAE